MSAIAKHRLQTGIDSAKGGHVALKGFFAIADKWQLSPDQCRILLGDIGKTTYHEYRKLPEVALRRDTLERISYVMGIYKSLRILFPSDERANAWMHRPNQAFPFNGGSALDWILQGKVMDLAELRRYLDAQRGGIG
jgi:hypothetical protein